MNPTGSSLEAAEKCAASFALPAIKDTSPSRARDIGTELHTAYERFQGSVPTEHLSDGMSAEAAAIVARVDWESLPHGLPEVSYAYDAILGTARRLGQQLGRDYSMVSATEIPCTTDAEMPDGVVDLKTHASDWHPNLTRTEWNLQLGHQALCWSLVHGKDQVRVRMVHLYHDGRTETDEHVYTSLDLDRVRQRIQALYDRIVITREEFEAGRQPDLTSGPHCDYCPAMRSCAAHIGVIRHVVSDKELTPDSIRARVRELDLPELASAFAAKERLRRIYDAFEDELSQRVRRLGAPLDLGDGREAYVREERPRFIVPKKALPIIVEAVGPVVAEAAVRLEITNETLTEAMRVHDASRGLSRRVENLFTLLDQNGAIERGRRTSVQTRKRKLEDGAESVPVKQEGES